MKELSDYYGIMLILFIACFLYFLPEIREACQWISNRAKESQQLGETSRKITELQKYDDRLQKEVEKEIISEHDVKMHCVNTNFREFKCKNCGDNYNSLAISRNNEDYCSKCGCWLCNNCRGELCLECKNQKQTKI